MNNDPTASIPGAPTEKPNGSNGMSDKRAAGARGKAEHPENGETNGTEALHDAAHRLGAQATELGGRAYEKAQEVGGKVYEKAVEAGRNTVHRVEEQPLMAAMFAGAIGLAVGFIIGRESSERHRSIREYAQHYLPRNFR